MATGGTAPTAAVTVEVVDGEEEDLDAEFLVFFVLPLWDDCDLLALPLILLCLVLLVLKEATLMPLVSGLRGLPPFVPAEDSVVESSNVAELLRTGEDRVALLCLLLPLDLVEEDGSSEVDRDRERGEAEGEGRDISIGSDNDDTADASDRERGRTVLLDLFERARDLRPLAVRAGVFAVLDPLDAAGAPPLPLAPGTIGVGVLGEDRGEEATDEWGEDVFRGEKDMEGDEDFTSSSMNM